MATNSWQMRLGSILCRAMCPAKYSWSHYRRKWGKYTFGLTHVFATCTHTKEKTQRQKIFYKRTHWWIPAFGKLVFVYLHFFHLPKHKSPTSISCFRVWGHVFIRSSTAWQAHSTEGLEDDFGYSRMYLICPTWAQLWSSNSFGNNNLFINNHGRFCKCFGLHLVGWNKNTGFLSI